MNSNGRTFLFSPFWLNMLSKEDRAEVQQWLNDAGIDLMRCPGFDYDPIGHLITTVYYATDFDGSTMVNDNLEPFYEDQVREFNTKATPEAVVEYLNA